MHGLGSANTHAIYGQGADKELTELVPGIINQLGPDSLASLRKLAESYQAMNAAQQSAGGIKEDDDEVPDVVSAKVSLCSCPVFYTLLLLLLSHRWKTLMKQRETRKCQRWKSSIKGIIFYLRLSVNTMKQLKRLKRAIGDESDRTVQTGSVCDLTTFNRSI